MTRRITLTQFLVEQQRAANAIKPELRLLIEVVCRVCKAIAVNVGKGALAGMLGSAGTDPHVARTQQHALAFLRHLERATR